MHPTKFYHFLGDVCGVIAGPMRFLMFSFTIVLWAGCEYRDVHAFLKPEGVRDRPTQNLPPAGIEKSATFINAAMYKSMGKPVGNSTLSTEELADIKSLDLDGKQINDLTAMPGLKNLVFLDLSVNQIADLKPLAAQGNLNSLILSDNRVESVVPLGGLSHLEYLDLRHNRITALKPLAGMKSLKTLYLSANYIEDLTPLAGMTELERLYLHDNKVVELASLSGLKVLRVLTLAKNPELFLEEVEKLQVELPMCNIRHNAERKPEEPTKHAKSPR